MYGKMLAFVGLAMCAASAAASSAPTAASLRASSAIYEDFGPGWQDRWIHSQQAKYTGRFKAVKPETWAEPGLQVPEANKHYGISAVLPSPLDPATAGIIVQYEVKYTAGVTCGGAYLKLLTAMEGDSLDVSGLTDASPYSIMFGPDKCGTDAKVHLILRHKSPVDGEVREHHLETPPAPLTDALTHVYTLRITPDSKFSVLIDGEEKASGSLLEALKPSINPPAEISDAADIKPSNWVDNEKMPDPEARQPEDWDMRKEIPDESAKKPSGWLDDEPPMTPDTNAKRPEEWDDEEDGEWTPPVVVNPKCKKGNCGEWVRPTKPNPDYKGLWKAPLVENPAYQGPWVQKTIPNPAYFEDREPLKAIGAIAAVAIEIWTIDSGYTFDNIYVAQGSQAAAAAQLRDEVWKPRQQAEKLVAEREERKAADAHKASEAAAKAQDRKGRGFTGLVESWLDNPRLSFAKPVLQPLLDMLEVSPNLVWLLAAIPPLLFILTLLLCTRGTGRLAAAKARNAVRRAKKEDITGPDDVAEEEEEAEEADGTDNEQAEAEQAEEGLEEDLTVQGHTEQELLAHAVVAEQAAAVARHELPIGGGSSGAAPAAAAAAVAAPARQAAPPSAAAAVAAPIQEAAAAVVAPVQAAAVEIVQPVKLAAVQATAAASDAVNTTAAKTSAAVSSAADAATAKAGDAARAAAAAADATVAKAAGAGRAAAAAVQVAGQAANSVVQQQQQPAAVLVDDDEEEEAPAVPKRRARRA